MPVTDSLPGRRRGRLTRWRSAGIIRGRAESGGADVTYVLHGARGSGSCAVECVLAEIGVGYKRRDPPDTRRSPPRDGRLPAKGTQG